MPYIQDVVKNDAGEDVTISIEVDEAVGRSSYRDTRGAGQLTLKWEQKDSSDGKH